MPDEGMDSDVDQSEALGDLVGTFAGLAPTGDGYRVTLRVDDATSGYDGPSRPRRTP